MRKLIPYMAVLIAVSIAFSITACAPNDRSQTGQTGMDRSETQGKSETAQTRMSDSDAEQLVKNKLKSDPQLSGTDIDVSTDVENNEIKLSGTVESEEVRNRALQIARSSLPGFVISDTIDVQPREMARSAYDEERGTQQEQGQSGQTGQTGMPGMGGSGATMSDSDLRTQIESKLSERAGGRENIQVDVKNGVVTLRGNVGSENEKSEIQRMVQNIQGVKRIDNKLQMAGSGSPSQ